MRNGMWLASKTVPTVTRNGLRHWQHLLLRRKNCLVHRKLIQKARPPAPRVHLGHGWPFHIPSRKGLAPAGLVNHRHSGPPANARRPELLFARHGPAGIPPGATALPRNALHAFVVRKCR